MNYLYYKSNHGNFGDDLNQWLWPKLFTDSKSEIYFLGIGSILFAENPDLKKIETSRKIVFGTGIRPTDTYSELQIDSLWNVLFLRGPLSSYMLNNKFPYITDAAYALRLIKEFDTLSKCEKKYEVSLMPYFKSLDYIDWPKLCDELGYHYISPLSENGVEFTMREIAASKNLITEAMHGAIVADILRVPWHRFVFTTPHTEGSKVSDFKWTDWTLSLSLDHPTVTFIPFYQDTRIHSWLKTLSADMISAQFLVKPRLKRRLIEKLSKANKFYLSSDAVINQIDGKISEKVEDLKKLLTDSLQY